MILHLLKASDGKLWGAVAAGSTGWSFAGEGSWGVGLEPFVVGSGGGWGKSGMTPQPKVSMWNWNINTSNKVWWILDGFWSILITSHEFRQKPGFAFLQGFETLPSPLPTTFLVFVSRSCPAPICGCWSACFFFKLIGPAQWTIAETLYVAIVFIDPAHRPITKAFYSRYPCWYYLADPLRRPITKISPSNAVLMDILHSVLHGVDFFWVLSAKPPLWKSFLARPGCFSLVR